VDDLERKVDDLERKVVEHGIRIDNVERSQRESEARIMEQIREVQRSMREEIARLDEKAEAREKATMERLNKFENKLDSALEKLRRATPPWVGPVIGSLIAIGGWLYHTR
jgi:predicted RNA-binding Zn ribbon-like protein